jgi:Terpene cyclase DEP1
MLQAIYLGLCVLGTIIPYWHFIPFLAENGLNLPLFIEQLFTNSISSMFGADLLISLTVFFVFLFVEGNRLKMEHLWVYVASSLSVGLSLGLPLFLLMRERRCQRIEQGEWGRSLNSTATTDAAIT